MKLISKIVGAGLSLLFIGSSTVAQSLADAKKAIDDEQYQKAKSMLKNLTITQADKDENFFYLGWVYLKQDYPDSAKTVFNKGLAVNGKSSLNFTGLGAVAHIEKDVANATSNFNSAIEIASKKNSTPFLYVGLSYLLPLNGSSLGPNGPVIRATDAAAAIAVLNKGLLANPKDAQIYIAIGDANRAQSKSTDAYNAYSSALTIDPKLAAANVAEGVLWRFTVHFVDSEEQFQAALAIDPNFGPAYREWAETDIRWANRDPSQHDAKIAQAVDNYKKYINLTDYSVESQMRYADFLKDAEDYPTLQKVATDLTASAKSNLRVYRYLTALKDSIKLVDFPYDATHNKIIYEEVVQSGLSKDQLFKNAQSWISKEFGDYKSVIQFEDKEAGRIICKGNIQVSPTLDQRLYFTLTIDIKPQKYRSQISDISDYMENGSGGSIVNTLEDDIERNLKRTDSHHQEGLILLNNLDLKIKSILYSIKTGMDIKDDF